MHGTSFLPKGSFCLSPKSGHCSSGSSSPKKKFPSLFECGLGFESRFLSHCFFSGRLRDRPHKSAPASHSTVSMWLKQAIIQAYGLKESDSTVSCQGTLYQICEWFFCILVSGTCLADLQGWHLVTSFLCSTKWTLQPYLMPAFSIRSLVRLCELQAVPNFLFSWPFGDLCAVQPTLQSDCFWTSQRSMAFCFSRKITLLVPG